MTTSGGSSVVLVEDVETCRAAVEALLGEDEVAIDLEGVDLGRHPGNICILQACGKSSSTVYLFDIVVLGNEAFESGSSYVVPTATDLASLIRTVTRILDAPHEPRSREVRAHLR